MDAHFRSKPDEPVKRKPTTQAPPKQAADWLAWSMQFVFGLVVGALLSVIGTGRGRGGTPLIPSEHAGLFSAGVGLVVAAIASHYGDQLWLGSSYRVIPPDAPQQSKASCVASVATGIVGGLLVLKALCDTFGLGS